MHTELLQDIGKCSLQNAYYNFSLDTITTNNSHNSMPNCFQNGKLELTVLKSTSLRISQIASLSSSSVGFKVSSLTLVFSFPLADFFPNYKENDIRETLAVHLTFMRSSKH